MGRKPNTVERGNCPRCGTEVDCPMPQTQCGCGQWVVNRLDPAFHNRYLYGRRAPNKSKSEVSRPSE